jgi:hypothetical protein
MYYKENNMFLHRRSNASLVTIVEERFSWLQEKQHEHGQGKREG